MRTLNSALVATLLTGLFAILTTKAADDTPSTDGKRPTLMDVRALLEKGVAENLMPEGMVVRISACLEGLTQETPSEPLPERLQENWEFTPKEVRRVAFEADDEERAVESRPFDSKELCKYLLEGKAMEIQTRKGKGQQVAFAGSPYCRGSRFITVLWNGRTILDLHETNGPALQLYSETDARDFSALYDRLARQARLAFSPKGG